MKGNSKTETAATLAELLIEAAGGKEKAIRRIRAVKTKGKVGRPKGLPYRQVDAQLLWLVNSLRWEWMSRLPQGKRLPTRHAIIKRIVDLAWDDLEVCARLALPYRLGSDRNATVKRLLGRRPQPIRGITDSRGIDSKDFSDFGFVGTPRDPLGSGGVIGPYYSPPSELWEEFHRAQPGRRLLPDDVNATNRSKKLPGN
jgi:hypothetical protein